MLPSYVVSFKGAVRTFLERGNPAFQDPVDNRPYTTEQREEIFNQMSRICGISMQNWKSCFAPVPQFSKSRANKLAIDQKGHYSTKAREAISLEFPCFNDPNLPEIEAFFETFEEKIQKLLYAFKESPAFKEDLERYQSIPNPNPSDFYACFSESLEPFKDFALTFDLVIDNSQTVQYTIYAFFLIQSELGKNLSIGKSRELFERLYNEAKINHLKNMRLLVLDQTSFFFDLQEKHEANIRVKRFQKLCGIYLKL